MAISSLGVGSGLDLNGIITKLMQVEQQPLIGLQRKEANVQARISALGSLKSALSSLQTSASGLIPASGQSAADKFASFKATLADTAVASATASTGAVAGLYSLEVTALAQTQRLVSQQSASYTSSTSPLTATGTLRIAIGSMSTGSFVETGYKDIDMSASGKTLADLRDAINAAAAGVSATIITTSNVVGARAQLVLTSNATGQAGVMKLSGLSGFNFDPDTPAVVPGTMSQESADGGQVAQNAAFKINGIPTTSNSNTVSTVLDGLTLTLLKTNSGSPTTLTVTKDSSTGLKSALNALIKSYNDANKTARELGAYDASTKKAGALQGDATLRGVQSQFRSLIATTAGGTSVYQRLSDIGVAVQKDGSLLLDSVKLDAAITADYTGVTTLASAVGTAFKSALEGLVSSTGNITSAR
ncbi:MAG: flagellar filament capping protein FliD [Propionivibrio sp.]|uniref:Flagellar hook-associated protein 2 n=1 Tax=Candidatus Propionivibrio dominans TaxID=2954373 RepID=A0A9D7FFI9_9RHOO|nr:flagellar filament capping protein FliD [Candidatus Propionivibrio dominans]